MNLFNNISLYFSAVVFCLFSSCTNDEFNYDLLKPDSKIEMGELLVVLNKKYWDGSINKTLKINFERLITTTPLPYEPEYDLQLVDHGGLNNMIKKYKTILIIDVNHITENNVQSLSAPIFDLWAKNQIIFKISASSEEHAVQLITQHAGSIKKEITKFYHKNILSSFGENSNINNQLKSMYNVSLFLPSNMKIKSSSTEFTWLSRTQIKEDNNGDHEIQQGVFIYSYPYKDKNIFSLKKQVQIRDSVLMKNVHGDIEGSYMMTRKDKLAKIDTLAHMINNLYVYETRGLWRVEKDKMGGPYISISTYDEARERILTIEGYVYAPNFEKRELIRELEAIIYSFQFN